MRVDLIYKCYWSYSNHFEKNEKNQFFTPVGAGGNQWVQNTENVFFEKSVSCFCQQF